LNQLQEQKIVKQNGRRVGSSWIDAVMWRLNELTCYSSWLAPLYKPQAS